MNAIFLCVDWHICTLKPEILLLVLSLPNLAHQLVDANLYILDMVIPCNHSKCTIDFFSVACLGLTIRISPKMNYYINEVEREKKRHMAHEKSVWMLSQYFFMVWCEWVYISMDMYNQTLSVDMHIHERD